jgi:predicted nucleotidyltransferase
VTEPSFDELLRRLVEAQVQFVLVGGLAVNAWGVVRGTKDVDIAVDPDAANLTAIADVAAGVNGVVQRADAIAGSRFSIAALLGGGERVLIDTNLGPLDVIQGLDGVPPYAELRSRAVDVTIAGVSVPVCSLEDLRAMKHATGRTRDLADLEDLDEARGRD